jgi:hypothetical protein
MNEPANEGWTLRGAAPPGGRALLSVGAAGLAAVAAPAVAVAGTKAKKRCSREKSQCREGVRQRCGVNQSCIDSFLQCCDTCKVAQGVACVLSQP